MRRNRKNGAREKLLGLSRGRRIWPSRPRQVPGDQISDTASTDHEIKMRIICYQEQAGRAGLPAFSFVDDVFADVTLAASIASATARTLFMTANPDGLDWTKG